MEHPGTTLLTKEDLEDDISVLLTGDALSVPFGSGPEVFDSDDDHESLSTSQYAMVVFQDILDSYPTDSDVCCRYLLNSDLEIEEGDYIALFKVGWNSTDEAILKHPALSPDILSKRGGNVLFRADSLPKDDQEFYQLCYVNSDGSVCGASVPFQFRRPHEEELCTISMMEGDQSMVVVRSRTAVAEEKLRKVEELRDETQREKEKLAAELDRVREELVRAREEISGLKLTSEAEIKEKNNLLEVLETTRQRERHVAKLQSEIQALDKSRTLACNDLRLNQLSVQSLNATVETLSADKARMANLLRENVRRADEMAQQLLESNKRVSLLEERANTSSIDCQNLFKDKERYMESMRLQTSNASEREQHLLNELTALRNDLLNSERVKQDVELLREHRSNLEQQLQLTEDKYRSLKSDYSDLQKRETDLVNQVLKLSQKITDSGDLHSHSGLFCNHCNSAAMQMSKLEEQVADLRTRLDQGAQEYKKVYVEKCKAEKKLTKSSSKKQHGSKDSLSGDGGGSSSRACPVCKITFPPGANELFSQHFENHLS